MNRTTARCSPCVRLKFGRLRKSTFIHSITQSVHTQRYFQRCVSTGVERTSRLFLADLGGSEQVKKSLVEVKKLNLQNAFVIMISCHSSSIFNLLSSDPPKFCYITLHRDGLSSIELCRDVLCCLLLCHVLTLSLSQNHCYNCNNSSHCKEYFLL